MALESTLVPEHDYNTRRIGGRAAKLIATDPDQIEDIRSRIVHGGTLSGENREWLLENHRKVEHRVREVLIAAVRKLPQEEHSPQGDCCEDSKFSGKLIRAGTN